MKQRDNYQQRKLKDVSSDRLLLAIVREKGVLQNAASRLNVALSTLNRELRLRGFNLHFGRRLGGPGTRLIKAREYRRQLKARKPE